MDLVFFYASRYTVCIHEQFCLPFILFLLKQGESPCATTICLSGEQNFPGGFPTIVVLPAPTSCL